VTVLETTKKLGATVFVVFVLISFWSNPSGSAQVFTDFIGDVGAFFSTVTCQLEDETNLVQILEDQLGAPVRFTQAIQALAAGGVTTCIEVGPGGVLAGLMRRIDRNLTALAISDPESLAKAQEVLGNG
jgi:malonyl CoA-acyl carrier protein transacylase